MSLTEKVKQYFSRGRHRKEKPRPAEEGNVIATTLMADALRRSMTQSERDACIRADKEKRKMAPANKAFANYQWK
jgi:hypothetical protein